MEKFTLLPQHYSKVSASSRTSCDATCDEWNLIPVFDNEQSEPKCIPDVFEIMNPLCKTPNKGGGIMTFEDECDEEWEVVSTIDKKIIGSFSPEPRNTKEIITNAEFTTHVLLPTDTLQGICLLYRISPTKLRQINRFSGNNLYMAPKTLRIPINKCKNQNTSSNYHKTHNVLTKLRSARAHLQYTKKDAELYLNAFDQNVEKAVEGALSDAEWEEEEERIRLEANEFCGFGVGKKDAILKLGVNIIPNDDDRKDQCTALLEVYSSGIITPDDLLLHHDDAIADSNI